MFNSRDPIHRSPQGAVVQGKPVHFKITVPRHYACSAAYLIVEQEKTAVLDLFWCGMNGEDKEWWECDFVPDAPGLYFYHFELKTNHGRFLLNRGFGSEAVQHSTAPWQLTVYSKQLKTPDWLAGGILYQIFPDRFHKADIPTPSFPGERIFHENWGEEPVWAPNENGAILNNDFSGGNLRGIAEKLPYLKGMGVTCIYLNPIFQAYSNHRYDTGNYAEIDPLLGTREDFTALCKAAKALGIHILLDGVFSHTGDDSLYFNRRNHYAGQGAYQSKESPYYSWYSFKNWPEEYDCWWGFTTLPNLNECNPQYNEYINGENGIVRSWMRAGADGWRLDVADELPDAFLDNLYAAAKAENPEALVMGEVWEDATTKTAYGQRRRYLLGGQMDTVMNYPFRDAILNLFSGGSPADFFELVETILENYPPQCIRLLMNHIGTHDTERVLTLLGGEPTQNRDRQWQSLQKLTNRQYETGTAKLKLAALIQYTLPGVPCIYYGDEAGMQGYKDPFNRKTYPWDNQDQGLLEWYRQLGKFRHSQPVLAEGAFQKLYCAEDVIGYMRYTQDGAKKHSLLMFINRGDKIRVLNHGTIPNHARLILGTDPRPRGNELAPYGCAVFACLEDLPQGPTGESQLPGQNSLQKEKASKEDAEEFIKILDN